MGRVHGYWTLSEETKAKMREAWRKRKEANGGSYRAHHPSLNTGKTCVRCGKIFFKREDEPVVNFLKRKKCGDQHPRKKQKIEYINVSTYRVTDLIDGEGEEIPSYETGTPDWLTQNMFWFRHYFPNRYDEEEYVPFAWRPSIKLGGYGKGKGGSRAKI